MLGLSRIERDGDQVIVNRRKALALLAYLAVKGKGHTRDALALRQSFVARSRWLEDVVGRHITAAAEALPPEFVSTAQERGGPRYLWATIQRLVARLPADRARGLTG